jgi:hypothetical protein
MESALRVGAMWGNEELAPQAAIWRGVVRVNHERQGAVQELLLQDVMMWGRVVGAMQNHEQ